MSMENTEILEYKNFYLFYRNLYTRLFDLINILIDEREYNILKLKNLTIDFLDSYSYYLFKQKYIGEDEQEKTIKDLLKELKDFSKFYESLNKYPSDDYIKIRQELIRGNLDLKCLSSNKQEILINEYYLFYQELLQILKKFVDVTSECGFLPNVKSMSSKKSIGYANFDLFFTNLENLKIKASDITSNINISNSLISRRTMYCILVIFSPYFKTKRLYEDLEQDLNFKFLEDKTKIELMRKLNNYNDYDKIPKETIKELEQELLNPLKTNISIIKRYISYEFGERDMSPTIKKKYSYDPTGV